MSEVQIGPSANPTARKFVRELEQRRKLQDDADTRFMFSDPRGRRFMARFLLELGLYDPVATHEKRSVALGLRLRAILLNPQDWYAIEREILARRIDTSKIPLKEPEDE